MGEIDVSEIALALWNVRVIPFLGHLLRRIRSSSKKAAIALWAPVFAVPLAVAATSVAHHRHLFHTIFTTWLAFLMMLPFLIAATWLPRLDKRVRQYSLGSYIDWLDFFYCNKRDVPMMFPKGIRRNWAFFRSLATIVPGAIGLLLTAVFFLPGAVILAPRLYIAAWRRIRRHTATSSSVVLKTDQRAPILFLRSFRDDDLKVRSVAGFASGKLFHFEEKIAIELWREGPFIALGKPGEWLPRFGACREYHTEDIWPRRVIELIIKARSVLVLVGITDALGWEIDQLRQQRVLAKSIFLLPPVSKRDMSVRLTRLSEHLPELSSSLRRYQGTLSNALCVVIDAWGRPICFTSKGQTPFEYGVAVHAAFTRLRL